MKQWKGLLRSTAMEVCDGQRGERVPSRNEIRVQQERGINGRGVLSMIVRTWWPEAPQNFY